MDTPTYGQRRSPNTSCGAGRTRLQRPITCGAGDRIRTTVESGAMYAGRKGDAMEAELGTEALRLATPQDPSGHANNDQAKENVKRFIEVWAVDQIEEQIQNLSLFQSMFRLY